jgi:hypothetical protein
MGTAVVALVSSYEVWTFLVLKLILLLSIVVVLLSGLGGCLTKACRKEKYKELKCFDNEDEGSTLSATEAGGLAGSGGGAEDDASRCTSVTLMSFDYTYWRRLRLLRLKHFLLRPRPLNYLSAKVKSFPSTPTQSHLLVKKRLQQREDKRRQHQPSCSSKLARRGQSGGGGDRMDPSAVTASLLPRSVSLSDTNLRVKGDELISMEKEVKRRSSSSKRYSKCEDNSDDDQDHHHHHPLRDSDDEGKKKTKTMCRVGKSIYCIDPLGSGARVVVATASQSSGKDSPHSLNGSSSYSISTPTNPSSSNTLSEKTWSANTTNAAKRQSEKLLKEKENEKRRASSERILLSSCSSEQQQQCILKGRLKSRSQKKDMESGTGPKTKRLLKKRDIEKSQLSVATSSSIRFSSSCGEDDSRVASRAGMAEDADHDFEMDYYDYDVLNVGTIPGSYLGLEPAFVLWNSEVYTGEDHGEDEQDPDDDDDDDDDNLMIPCSSSGGGASSHEEDNTNAIEMTTTSHSASTSLGIFSDFHCNSSLNATPTATPNRKRIRTPLGRKEYTSTIPQMKETSLDTLKFADEDDDEDEFFDDNATHASDSAFDNEHDLINDPVSKHNLTSCS